MTIYEDCLKNVKVYKLLRELGVPKIEAVIQQIEHFAQMEADRRDRILLSYFGEDGIKRIIDSIVQGLLSHQN